MTVRRPSNPKKGNVYVIRDHVKDLYKIGFARIIENRFAQLQTANAGIELVWAFCGTTDDEADLHERFSEKWISGEWFILIDSDVQWIISEYKHRNQERGLCYPGYRFRPLDRDRIKATLSKWRPLQRS